MKLFEAGEQVNIVRGNFKGTSAWVKSMDEETGRLTLHNGLGVEFDMAQGNVSRTTPEKANANFEPDLDDANADISEDGIRTEGQVIVVKPKAKTEKVQLPCECGCGALANYKRHFLPGHDQRHKGNLIEAMQNGSPEAEEELRKRGWRTNAEIIALKAKARKTSKLMAEDDAEVTEEAAVG